MEGGDLGSYIAESHTYTVKTKCSLQQLERQVVQRVLGRSVGKAAETLFLAVGTIGGTLRPPIQSRQSQSGCLYSLSIHLRFHSTHFPAVFSLPAAHLSCQVLYILPPALPLPVLLLFLQCGCVLVVQGLALSVLQVRLTL